MDLTAKNNNVNYKIEDYEYIGWIPTINGNIDFGFFTTGLSGKFGENWKSLKNFRSSTDKNTHQVNFSKSAYSDNHARRICIQSWVDWKDFTSDREGNTRVVVLAETNETDNLDHRFAHGIALIGRRLYKNKNQQNLYNDLLMTPINNLDRQLKEYKRLPDCERSSRWPEFQSNLNTLWEKLYSDVETHISKNSTFLQLYAVKFLVNSHGLTYLKQVGKLPDNTTDTHQVKYTLCRQAFYYLKYGLHSHKHHSFEQDALTTIVPIKTSADHKSSIPNLGEDYDIKVIGGMESYEEYDHMSLKLIGQLKREITKIKRTVNGSPRKYVEKSALGISAYLKSLINTLVSVNLINKDLATRELRWIDSVESSFCTQTNQINESHDYLVRQKQYVLNWTAITLTILSISTFAWINVNIRLYKEQFSALTYYHINNKLPILLDLYIGEWSFVYVILFLMASIYTIVKIHIHVNNLSSISRLPKKAMEKGWLRIFLPATAFISISTYVTYLLFR